MNYGVAPRFELTDAHEIIAATCGESTHALVISLIVINSSGLGEGYSLKAEEDQ